VTEAYGAPSTSVNIVAQVTPRAGLEMNETASRFPSGWRTPRRWRIYVYCHLLMVAFVSVGSVVDRFYGAVACQQNPYRATLSGRLTYDAIITFGHLATIVCMFAPAVTIRLFCLVYWTDRRYLGAAVLDSLVSALGWVALLVACS
jgi:hypothetical protein